MRAAAPSRSLNCPRRNAQKNAKLETGIEIKVPLFIEAGTKVKVYTETREFAGRA